MNFFKLDKVKGKYIYNYLYIFKNIFGGDHKKKHYMHALSEYMKPAPLIQLFSATFGFKIRKQ